jgi:hypothetical protein
MASTSKRFYSLSAEIMPCFKLLFYMRFLSWVERRGGGLPPKLRQTLAAKLQKVTKEILNEAVIRFSPGVFPGECLAGRRVIYVSIWRVAIPEG